jgi:predicted ArsR family transcriptional regulator
MAIEGSLAAEERQELLLSTLREESRVGIEDAAKRLGVHPMTIRRALNLDVHDSCAVVRSMSAPRNLLCDSHEH